MLKREGIKEVRKQSGKGAHRYRSYILNVFRKLATISAPIYRRGILESCGNAIRGWLRKRASCRRQGNAEPLATANIWIIRSFAGELTTPCAYSRIMAATYCAVHRSPGSFRARFRVPWKWTCFWTRIAWLRRVASFQRFMTIVRPANGPETGSIVTVWWTFRIGTR